MRLIIASTSKGCGMVLNNIPLPGAPRAPVWNRGGVNTSASRYYYTSRGRAEDGGETTQEKREQSGKPHRRQTDSEAYGQQKLEWTRPLNLRGEFAGAALTDWAAYTMDMDSFTALEARSIGSRCWQGGFF